jgi:hypothetical protein
MDLHALMEAVNMNHYESFLCGQAKDATSAGFHFVDGKK